MQNIYERAFSLPVLCSGRRSDLAKMGFLSEKSGASADPKTENVRDGSDVESVQRNAFTETKESLRARRK